MGSSGRGDGPGHGGSALVHGILFLTTTPRHIPIMENVQDFQALQDQIRPCLLNTCSTVKKISEEDLAFQRSLNPAVGSALEEQSQRLLSLASALIKSAASISELRVPVLEDAEDVENNWRGVVDVVDSLLEKSDTCLDEYTGLIKRKDMTEKAALNEPLSKPKKPNSTLAHNFRNQNIIKPQLSFDVKPDNHDVSPWKPFLTTKPHATIPLEDSLILFTNDFGQEQYRHPYETEISSMKYPDFLYEKADPIPYQHIETTSAILVDTEEAVMQMIDELRGAKVIAVDLEHHDTRSYHGLLSLMQISTRDKDWIVDTLKPWRRNLQALNEIFANPSIIKVFHGAFMDIVWLQRDLGLYVVGLFDTFRASQALGYTGGSLAFLLKKFVNFDADKVYQMADWRIRPLPEEMVYYARADTHYLLYIFDHMRNELLDRSQPQDPDKDLMEIVLQKSKETSLSRYERQVYNTESGKGPGGWYPLLVKSPALLSNEQFAVFRAVHAWRDKIARLDDDSPSHVMNNHALFNLAKVLPTDMLALLRTISSHNVKSRAAELLEVIKAAKSAEGPSMKEALHSGSKSKSKPSLGNQKDSVKKSTTFVNQKELWSDSSSFWGTAFGSSAWDGKSRTLVDVSKSMFQLPTFPPDVEISNTVESQDASAASVNVAAHSPDVSSQKSKEHKSFVLKSGNPQRNSADKSHKEISRKETDHQNSENMSNITPSDTESGTAKRANEQPSYHQNTKKQAISRSEISGSKDIEGSETPFDYRKAQSVLHSKVNQNNREDFQQKKPFNPYTKSADAFKGMRRSQTERAGKSYTFKK
ncbi:Exosome complex exonuclease [Podosphaera aphanis]|nr:Exosome complex exonuclease [Podosphaera aphanis]